MHFCPQEAMVIAAVLGGGGAGLSYLGWWLRGLLHPNTHTHCEDDASCDKGGDTQKEQEGM